MHVGFFIEIISQFFVKLINCFGGNMGGSGSGRCWERVKATTAQYCQFDIRFWQRDGLLKPGNSFNSQWTCDGRQIASMGVRVEFGRLILSYSHRRHDWEPWRAVEVWVPLAWTRCNYGGSRVWLRCPLRGCGRRVAILYLGDLPACRHCHNLAYYSQRQEAYSRAMTRAQAIRRRLGGSIDMFEMFPFRPKGMHERTYLRLHLAYENLYKRSWPPGFWAAVETKLADE